MIYLNLKSLTLHQALEIQVVKKLFFNKFLS